MMAGKKLERVAEFSRTLFDQQGEPPSPIRPIGTVPKCPLCGNWGYVNCPQAKAPERGGDLIAIAFEQGTACTCAAGAEFARNQMEWMS